MGFMKAEQASKYQNTSNKELPLLEIFNVEYCGIIIIHSGLVFVLLDTPLHMKLHAHKY